MGNKYKALVLGFLFSCSVILPSLSFQKEVQAVEVAYTKPFSAFIDVKNIVWSGLTSATNDVGSVFAGLGAYDTATIEVSGTFGGGNVRIEASNDIGTPTWFTVKDITVAGIYVINAGYYQVRPKITSGTGLDVTVTLVATKSPDDANKLDDLLDVVIANPADLQTIGYNSASGKWINYAAGSGVGTPGGADTQIQFNNVGVFGGNAGLTFNKSVTNPVLILTDTDVSSADLQIDVDANIAQIRAVGGAANSLMSFDLSTNQIGIFRDASSTASIFRIEKPATATSPSELAAIEYQSNSVNRSNVNALYITASVSGTSIISNEAKANTGTVILGDTASVTNASCFQARLMNFGTGIIANGILFEGTGNFSGTGPITNFYGTRITQYATRRGGTRNYGFYYGTATLGAEPIGNFAIYADTDPSFFGGAVDINNTAPSITLTDTTALAKSLKIDVDGDMAQIREVGGAANSLITLNLNNGRFGFKSSAPDYEVDFHTPTFAMRNTSGNLTFVIESSAHAQMHLNSPTGFMGVLNFSDKWVIGRYFDDNFSIIHTPISAYSFFISNATGNIGIGTTSPTAFLHIKAGTATANTAPLKFTSGVNLTTPEIGAMEFIDNGTTGTLYITVNVAGVATRKAIAYQ